MACDDRRQVRLTSDTELSVRALRVLEVAGGEVRAVLEIAQHCHVGHLCAGEPESVVRATIEDDCVVEQGGRVLGNDRAIEQSGPDLLDPRSKLDAAVLICACTIRDCLEQLDRIVEPTETLEGQTEQTRELEPIRIVVAEQRHRTLEEVASARSVVREKRVSPRSP